MVEEKRSASEAQDIEREKEVTEPSDIMPEAEKIPKRIEPRKHAAKHWESRRISLPTANKAELVTKLYGGQSITIKNPNGADKDVTIGGSRTLVRNQHYMLDSGEKISISLSKEFGVTNFIEIWALPKSNGYTLDYFKVIGVEPITSGSD